jgi:phytanoyl-CoA hydroxylase
MTKFRFRNAEDQAAFERDGYFVRRIFDSVEVENLRGECNQRIAEEALIPNVDTNYFAALDPRADRLRLMTDWSSRAWSAPLSALFDGWQEIQPTVIVKPANGGPTAIHKHPPATDRPFSINITGWSPLIDCDEANGCLYMVPNSQHLLRHIETGFGGYLSDWDIGESIRVNHSVAVPLKAGEAVFFESSMFHGAFPNQSNTRRIAIATLIACQTEKAVTYRKDKSAILAFPLLNLSDCYGQSYSNLDVFSERAGAALREFPDWTENPNYAQIDALLRRKGPRAREDYDPLDTVRHLQAPTMEPPMPRAVSSHSWGIRHAISRIPGARRVYRSIKALAGKAAGK